MSTTTTEPTVTAIRITMDLDSLFQGAGYEPALCDEDATRAAYMTELSTLLADDYPGALIEITDAVVGRTEIAVDTDQDDALDRFSAKDDAAREAVWAFTARVREDVQQTYEAVYDQGTYWQEREA